MYIGPTSIVGPGNKIGGRTRPSGQRKCIRVFPLIYPCISLLFFRVGLIILSVFEGNGAACGASD